MTQLPANTLMGEFRLVFDASDPWGSTMAWWFAACGEMWERGLQIPPAWQYRASPFGGRDPDAYETPIVAEATDAGLVIFGRAMNRYAAKLKRCGCDY